MTGVLKVKVSNSRNSCEFELKRKITILSGNSGIGKTTLYEMIKDYNTDNIGSGVRLVCNKRVVALAGYNWEAELESYSDSIIVIDEEASTPFIKSQRFAEMVKQSDNYFLLITRLALPQLPYSVEEIYTLTGKKTKKFIKMYTEIDNLYEAAEIHEVPFCPEAIIIEDRKSGYQFWKKAVEGKNIECISADGKSNIYSVLTKYRANKIAVIADGAAFGSDIDMLVKVQKELVNRIAMYLPESFEWLILKSGLIIDQDADVLNNTADYVDSSFFSWEQFFTELLISSTKNDEFKAYDKKQLKNFYLSDSSIAKVLAIVRNLKI